MSLPPLSLLPTSVVGNHTIPSWLTVALEQIRQGAFGHFDIRETLDDAVTVAIDDQERAGVDVISDGGMRRQDFIMSFYHRLAGLHAVEPARKVGAPLYDRMTVYETVDRFTAPMGLGIVEEFRFACARTDRPLLPHIRDLQASQLVLEFANREMAELQLWREHRGDKELAAGLIDIKSFHAESPEEVADRIRAALKVTAPDRLWIVPDCGFCFVPRWLAFAKMRAMVEGTRMVRRELGG